MAAATDSVMSGESWGGLQSLNSGVVEEVTVVPCLDCTDLLTWTDWEPCTDQGSERRLCRQRGDDMIGFEKEMTEGMCQSIMQTMLIDQ